MPQEKIFLILSADFTSRKSTREKIISKITQDKTLTVKNIYSNEVDLNQLKLELLSFSFARDKIVVFKDALSLPKDIKSFIHEEIKTITDNNYLIFEVEDDFNEAKAQVKSTDKFFSYLFKKASLYGKKSTAEKEDISIKKLKYLVRYKNLPQALYVLEKIFNEAKRKDILGMQILGALTYQCGWIDDYYQKNRAFDLIYHTERALKTGKVDAQLGLELLITKLLTADK